MIEADKITVKRYQELRNAAGKQLRQQAEEIAWKEAKRSAAESGWEINWQRGLQAGIGFMERRLRIVDDHLDQLTKEYEEMLAQKDLHDSLEECREVQSR